MNKQYLERNTTLDKDLSLKAELHDALADHPFTADAVIEVINDRGIITLAGEVDSAEAREAAEAIAESQPGVMTVINELKIRH